MKNKDRKDGFYWVVFRGNWGVAEWKSEMRTWIFNGYEVAGGEFFDKIYNKIEHYGSKEKDA